MSSDQKKAPALLADEPDDVDLCQVCAVTLVPGDVCAADIELGTCHAACLEGVPVVYLDTGEPCDGVVDTFIFEADSTPPKEQADG